jgi:UDP-2,3-diacylglucosamine pyrophosphatase LpxH
MKLYGGSFMHEVLDAIILSDLHLGSDNCRARELVDFLEGVHVGFYKTSKLILNGDVFDSIDFRRLKKFHWRVLSMLRKLSDDLEITWIQGNHDGDSEIVSNLLGVKMQGQYIFQSGGRKILALHGHVFDQFISKHPLLTNLADCMYHFLQWVDPSHKVAKIAKKSSKTFLRCADKMEREAIAMANKLGCHVVCCGHSHNAVEKIDGEVEYYNSGSWTETNPTYLSVRNGVVKLRTYLPVEYSKFAENLY